MFRTLISVKKTIREAEALGLISGENALINTISSDMSGWEYNIRQYKDPKHNRPVKRLSSSADRSHCYDPRDGQWYTRAVKSQRGAAKITDKTKKKSTSLLPADGRMNLFCGLSQPVALLYNVNKCDLRESKYIFRRNEGTNAKWWIKGQDYRSSLPRAVTLDAIREENRRARTRGEIPGWNEILACTTLDSIAAVFVSIDELPARLNALHKKLLLRNELCIEVLILIVRSPGMAIPVTGYSLKEQVLDIFTALTEHGTFARGTVDLIFNKDFRTIADFINFYNAYRELRALLGEQIADTSVDAKNWPASRIPIIRVSLSFTGR